MERKPASILEIVEREQRHSLSDRELNIAFADTAIRSNLAKMVSL